MPGALKESSPQTSLNRLLGPIQIYQVGISVLINSVAGLSGKIQDFQLSLKFRLVRNEFLPKPKNICSNWDTLIFEFNRTSLLFFSPVSCFSQSGNLPPGVLCLRLRTRVEGRQEVWVQTVTTALFVRDGMEFHKYDCHLLETEMTYDEETEMWGQNHSASGPRVKFSSRRDLDFTRRFKRTECLRLPTS